MVRTDHVAASPVEWKHIQTLIRFLILHNIFIRYHRTLEKIVFESAFMLLDSRKKKEERMVACVQDSSDSNAFRCVLLPWGWDTFVFNYLNLFLCSFFSCICNYALVLICLPILSTHHYF